MAEKRIYERNPDTGEVRSRPFGDHDPKNIRIETPASEHRQLQTMISRLMVDASVEDLNKVIHFLNGGDAIH
jgi:hypothetical protein